MNPYPFRSMILKELFAETSVSNNMTRNTLSDNLNFGGGKTTQRDRPPNNLPKKRKQQEAETNEKGKNTTRIEQIHED